MSYDPAGADRDRAFDSAVVREAARARSRRIAGGGSGEEAPPLTADEKREQRLRRARSGAWSYWPSPRTSHSSPLGWVGGLLLEIGIGLAIRALWPVLVAWMSFRRAAGIVGGVGCGMLVGGLLLPRLAFPEDRPSDVEMIGLLTKGEVVVITLAVLVLGFGGSMIALLSSQQRSASEPPTAQPPSSSRRPGAARDALLRRILHLADPLAVAHLVLPRHPGHGGILLVARGLRQRPRGRGDAALLYE